MAPYAARATPVAIGNVSISGNYGVGGGNCFPAQAPVAAALVAKSDSFAFGETDQGFQAGGHVVSAGSMASNAPFIALGAVSGPLPGASILPPVVIEPACAPWGLLASMSSVVLTSGPIPAAPGAFGRNTEQLSVVLTKFTPSNTNPIISMFDIALGDIILSGVGARSSFSFEVIDGVRKLMDLTIATPTISGDELIESLTLDELTGSAGTVTFDPSTDTYTIKGGRFFGTLEDFPALGTTIAFIETTNVAIPEPSAALLFGAGLLGFTALCGLKRRAGRVRECVANTFPSTGPAKYLDKFKEPCRRLVSAHYPGAFHLRTAETNDFNFFLTTDQACSPSGGGYQVANSP